MELKGGVLKEKRGHEGKTQIHKENNIYQHQGHPWLIIKNGVDCWKHTNVFIGGD